MGGRRPRKLTAAPRSGRLAAGWEPRATGHITQMIEMIERSIQAGHAYTRRCLLSTF